MALDRRHQAIEIAVQQAQHLVARQLVAERREAAQVGEQDHRLDALAVATPDPALQDMLAGVAPDIGVEQVGGRAAQGIDLGEAGKRQPDGLERARSDWRKPPGTGAGPADRVDLAAGEGQGLDQIVGHALEAQLVEDVEVVAAVRALDLAAHRLPGLEHVRHRAAPKGVGRKDIMAALRDLDRLAGPPDKPPAHDVRMEGAHEDGDPMQRQVASDQAIAQLAQKVLGLVARSARLRSAIRPPKRHRPVRVLAIIRSGLDESPRAR